MLTADHCSMCLYDSTVIAASGFKEGIYWNIDACAVTHATDADHLP